MPLQQGRFAGTPQPDDHQEFSGLYLEADVAQGYGYITPAGSDLRGSVPAGVVEQYRAFS